jgi:hypothetical protein
LVYSEIRPALLRQPSRAGLGTVSATSRVRSGETVGGAASSGSEAAPPSLSTLVEKVTKLGESSRYHPLISNKPVEYSTEVRGI